MKDELPEDIMDFDELRGYIWGWLSKYITEKKDFDGNEQAIKSIDYYFDWFVDKVNELEKEDVRLQNTIYNPFAPWTNCYNKARIDQYGYIPNNDPWSNKK